MRRIKKKKEKICKTLRDKSMKKREKLANETKKSKNEEKKICKKMLRKK